MFGSQAADHPLHGVYVKLARARYHAADLEQRLSVALDLGPDAFIREEDGEPTKLVYRIRRVPEIDPQWQAIVGDCLANMRAALDHLAWQLVILDGQQPRSQGKHKTNFPILKTRPHDAAGNDLLPDLNPKLRSQEIREALDRVQPYTRDPYTEHFIWVAKSLVNIDKHTLLLVLIAALNWERTWWGVPDGMNITGRISVEPLKDGDPVAWFDFHGAIPPMDFDPNLSLTVRIHQPEVVQRLSREPAARALGALASWMRLIVYAEFERHLFR